MKKIHIFIIATLAAGVAAWLLEPTGRLACMCAAFGVGATISHFVTRNVISMSYRRKLFDHPDGRRIHTVPVSRLGGVFFAPVIACAVILAMWLHAAQGASYTAVAGRIVILLCPLILLQMVGIVDDLTGVRWSAKFAAQIASAALVVCAGFWINDLHGFAGIHALPPAVGMPLTVLLIVLAINAVNLIDGMDGLAAGLCMLAMGVYGARYWMEGSFHFTVVAAATFGTLLPFLYANVRGISRRHKIFMGDTGSLTLGLVVSVMAVNLLMDRGGAEAGGRWNFVLAVSPLIVPVFDLVHVALSRLIRGKHPWRPDMTHLHHRLMRTGLKPRSCVRAILVLAAAYVAVNAMMAPRVGVTLIVLADAAIWFAFDRAVAVAAKRRAEPTEVKSTGQ